MGRRAFGLTREARKNANTAASAVRKMIGLRPVGEAGLVIGVGAKAPAPAVATVMVKGATAPFATATVGGTVHVAPNGRPEHANVSVPLLNQMSNVGRLNADKVRTISVVLEGLGNGREEAKNLIKSADFLDYQSQGINR